ncbi:MAG: hypothetical protein ACOYLX_21930 [Burkholderiaceae bacterium]
MTFERLPAIAAATVLLWGMTGPLPAEAAKLGPLTVSSDFGEPLRAVVDVVDVALEVQPLAAELASPQTYAQLGIAFPKSLEGATVLLVALPQARWAVRVSSLRSVDEPDFNLVLSLTTSVGRQLRHYRLAADAPASAASPSVAPPAPAPDAAVAPAPAAAPAPSSEAASEAAVAVSRVPTQSVDPGQPMPSASVEASVPPPDRPRPSEAAQAAMSAAGAAGRGSEPRAATARAAPPAAATASVTARKRDTATPTAPATARDRLKLNGGGSGRASSRHGGRGSGAASDEIAFQAALSEAQARIRSLESIVADLRKLIDMRDKQIASVQAELAALQGGARSSDTMTAPMLAASIGAPTAAPVRVSAKDAPLAPTAAGTPAPDPVIDPLTVGGALAVLVLVLLGVQLWRRRRRAARSAEPDTFMS